MADRVTAGLCSCRVHLPARVPARPRVAADSGAARGTGSAEGGRGRRRGRKEGGGACVRRPKPGRESYCQHRNDQVRAWGCGDTEACGAPSRGNWGDRAHPCPVGHPSERAGSGPRGQLLAAYCDGGPGRRVSVGLGRGEGWREGRASGGDEAEVWGRTEWWRISCGWGDGGTHITPVRLPWRKVCGNPCPSPGLVRRRVGEVGTRGWGMMGGALDPSPQGWHRRRGGHAFPGGLGTHTADSERGVPDGASVSPDTMPAAV